MKKAFAPVAELQQMRRYVWRSKSSLKLVNDAPK
jgi:hypothetical protein